MQFMDKWVKPGLAGAFDLVPQCGCIMDLVRIWILFAIKFGLCSRILHLHPLIDFGKKWIEEWGDIFRDDVTPPGWLCLVALRCFSCFLPQRQSFRFLAGLRAPSPGVLLPERLPEVLPCPEFSDQWRQHEQQARVEVGGGRMASPSSTTTSSSPYTGRHSTNTNTNRVRIQKQIQNQIQIQKKERWHHGLTILHHYLLILIHRSSFSIVQKYKYKQEYKYKTKKGMLASPSSTNTS